MSSKVYEKLPLSLDQQVILLKERGLLLPGNDEEKLRYYLSNVNYYHLSIYFKFFQHEDIFTPGTTFSEVLSVYIFDNKLRLLMMELLERLEKSLKCRIVTTLTSETGHSHCHLNPDIYRDSEHARAKIFKIYREEVEKNERETSIYHYRKKYDSPESPPFWATIELLAFGQTVKLFKTLNVHNRNLVSNTFGIDETLLSNWMHGLSIIRNHCAHHSRLWNRDLTVILKIPKKDKTYFVDNKRLYNQFLVLQILLNNVNPDSSWFERLTSLLSEYDIQPKNMGFPDDWETRLLKIIEA